MRNLLKWMGMIIRVLIYLVFVFAFVFAVLAFEKTYVWTLFVLKGHILAADVLSQTGYRNSVESMILI